MADDLGARRLTVAGLVGVVVGCLAPALLPTAFGLPGYIVPLIVTTAGYGVFQTANNTAVMAGVDSDLRGVASGMLNLSRNLGLITGASFMGAVFAFAAAVPDLTAAQPAAVATGMRVTFGVASALIVVGLFLVVDSRMRGSGDVASLRPR